jgi:hypothetical protein
VGWGLADGDTLRYAAVGRNVAYLPVYYYNHAQTAAAYPFWVNADGSVQILEPDTVATTLRLSKINPSGVFLKRMKHGVFEGANRRDFSDAKILHTVEEETEDRFYSVTLKNPAYFRYVRYLSPPDAHCNVAEVELYEADGTRLRGRHIGTAGSYANDAATGDKAFDNDISTFYDAKEASGAWTGLDFTAQKSVGKIRYIPRNDGNGIYSGHTYELFRWTGNEWQSSKHVGAENLLLAAAPGNALYYLKNATTGKTSNRLFLLQDGKQIWP